MHQNEGKVCNRNRIEKFAIVHILILFLCLNIQPPEYKNEQKLIPSLNGHVYSSWESRKVFKNLYKTEQFLNDFNYKIKFYMPKSCLLQWYLPGSSEKILKIVQGCLSCLQNLPDKKCKFLISAHLFSHVTDYVTKFPPIAAQRNNTN